MIYDVVIVASGKGERAKLGYNKVFYKMKDGRTILECSASLFINDIDCKKIIIVTNEDCVDKVFKNDKVITTIGGKERKDSVENGLQYVESEYVLIHDGARPFLKKESLDELKNKLCEYDAVILAEKAKDTIKIVSNNKIEKTIDRNTVYLAQTPQGFKSDLIKNCYEQSKNKLFTDDASLVESCGYDVYVVENKFDNKKLTVETDFVNL